jgi:hypothetical protein
MVSRQGAIFGCLSIVTLGPAAVSDNEVHNRQHNDEQQHRVHGNPQYDGDSCDYQCDHYVKNHCTS